MLSDTHKIVTHADELPAGEFVRRFNEPTIDEMAIVMVGDQYRPRGIVPHRRNDQLTRVAETHRRHTITNLGWSQRISLQC